LNSNSIEITQLASFISQVNKSTESKILFLFDALKEKDGNKVLCNSHLKEHIKDSIRMNIDFEKAEEVVKTEKLIKCIKNSIKQNKIKLSDSFLNFIDNRLFTTKTLN